jgi:hypothetical protein
MSNRTRIILFIIISLIVTIAVFSFAPVPQDPAYHDLADSRSWLSIPNFADIVSNLLFILVGVLGLRAVIRLGHDRERFILPAERIPFAIAMVGIALVGLGSAHYHWSPQNQTIVWDRLPIALATMAVFSMVIVERIGVRIGMSLLPVLLSLGAGSVVYWYFTEIAGRGDLRPYGLVLFFPLLGIALLLLWFPPRYTGQRHLWALLGFYIVGRVMELFDKEVFRLTGDLISGHTLKHIFSAIACYALVRYVQHRRRI